MEFDFKHILHNKEVTVKFEVDGDPPEPATGYIGSFHMDIEVPMFGIDLYPHLLEEDQEEIKEQCLEYLEDLKDG